MAIYASYHLKPSVGFYPRFYLNLGILHRDYWRRQVKRYNFLFHVFIIITNLQDKLPMSQSANGQHFWSGGFIGEGVISHNVANKETFQDTSLLKAGIQLVSINAARNPTFPSLCPKK